ncbi:helix-turn-helix domain-containing protein [Saccharothrix australiensis]|uniref:Helix-turn-helix protein n=1 Tax=Saccharothrix australiensis TaxID=2072 RepID=A0A495VLG4_9PSEU|nr:helix-turn-helix transcriptional regulator [Saccharothrix australiensis]RKT49279.1 helix-turn-helix protein [Saccharothrix australiensis]RKT49377.1 helix-turn-helix protein [Saccharothrix australiensis]
MSQAKAAGLGAQLRALRKSRKTSMKTIASKLGWSESKVSRMETGLRTVESEEVAAYLALLGVTGAERERLMAMARTPTEPAWLETITGLPESSITLATWESQARSLTDWSPLLIPGLLQTMEYGRAYMLADRIPEAEVGVRLMARQHRQQVLDRIDYTAIVDETVLHRRVGSDRVRRNQLRHLLDVAHERTGVSIRVISVRAEAHAGLVSPWLLLEFEEKPPMVHIELSRSAVFFAEPAQTDTYVATRAQLLALAMDEGDSLRVIEHALRE